MNPRALYAVWKHFAGEPVRIKGVDCCVHVGKSTVVLIPEDECEADGWPVDALALPLEVQANLMADINTRLPEPMRVIEL